MRKRGPMPRKHIPPSQCFLPQDVAMALREDPGRVRAVFVKNLAKPPNGWKYHVNSWEVVLGLVRPLLKAKPVTMAAKNRIRALETAGTYDRWAQSRPDLAARVK